MIFLIIGLTGKNCAGKGTVAEYLVRKGFVYYSLSDIIREELTKMGKEHSRGNMINSGNELRKEFGPGVLAIKTNEKIKNKNQNFAIDSIRSPFEVKELRKNKGFFLVNVDAPLEIRFKRMLARNRAGDAKNIEELKIQEAEENKKLSTNQQVDKTIKMANSIIVNDSSFEELYKKIEKFLESKSKRGQKYKQ